MSWQVSVVGGVASMAIVFVIMTLVFGKKQEAFKTLFISLSLASLLGLTALIGTIAENDAAAGAYRTEITKITNVMQQAMVVVFWLWIAFILIRYLIKAILSLKDVTKTQGGLTDEIAANYKE